MKQPFFMNVEQTNQPLPEFIKADNAHEEGMDDESDTLFLDSLVAEANRALASLQTVDLSLSDGLQTPSLSVNYKESKRPIGKISCTEIPELADKVMAVKRMVLGGSMVT